MTYGANRHRKVDSNCREIVKILRELGFRVWPVNLEVDLVVQYGGLTMLCEVRPEDKPKTTRPGPQERFHGDFNVYWLSTLQDCLNLRQTLVKWSNAIRG